MLALVLHGAAALVLFATLFTTAGTVALQRLEGVFPKPGSDPGEVACMIVLGGAVETEVTTVRGGVELNQAADRFVEMARLARLFPDAKILVSGGDGSLGGTYEGDADASVRFLTSMGVDTSRLVRENTSRTTQENVANTRALMRELGSSPCLLITSAFHMPRAIGLFRTAGVDVVPWPVDYRTSGRARLGLDFTQPTSNAQLTATAVREWLGLAAYRALGRIDRIVPQP
ncbi:YdcF family protein [Pseudomonas sp. R2.Fl]|nr:YdcF family protein [Pseudomonas sp. R2.Fl]